MTFKDGILKKLAVRQNVSIGERFHVGPRTIIWAPQSLQIGRDVYVGKNVTIEVDGCIGDGVLIANSVGLVGRTDHDIRCQGQVIRRSPWVGNNPKDLSQPLTIGSDVWIGYGAIILSGVTIGDSAVIAAGAVVTKNVQANSIVAGNPATFVADRFNRQEFECHWEALRSKGFTRISDKATNT